jgi:uncharacterized damage-inducible protein DinB
MQITEVRERFDYLIETRSKFLETFRGIGWEAFARDRGATWGSMLGIFLHILDVEEGWLQYGAKKGSILNSPDRRTADYNRFDQLGADNSKVGALTNAYLRTLNDLDLDCEIAIQETDGILRRKLAKVLTHAAVDELAHIGEWICLLWQLDVKPPYIDWLDYRES